MNRICAAMRNIRIWSDPAWTGCAALQQSRSMVNNAMPLDRKARMAFWPRTQFNGFGAASIFDSIQLRSSCAHASLHSIQDSLLDLAPARSDRYGEQGIASYRVATYLNLNRWLHGKVLQKLGKALLLSCNSLPLKAARSINLKICVK